MKCPNCSKEILEDAVFCGFCGAKIGNPKKPEHREKIRKPVKIGRVIVLILLFLLFLAAGGTMGFFAAKNEGRIREFLGENKIVWSQSNESYTEVESETEAADPADGTDK